MFIHITLTPKKMSKSDIEKLQKNGFTDKNILDAAQLIGYFNYSNVAVEPRASQAVGQALFACPTAEKRSGSNALIGAAFKAEPVKVFEFTQQRR
jgi:hypothetical protein